MYRHGTLLSACGTVALYGRSALHVLGTVAQVVERNHRQETQEEPQEEGRQSTLSSGEGGHLILSR